MAHCDDLDAISGKAVLRRGDTVVMEVDLPVRQHQFDVDGCGMVLWTAPMGPGLDYSLVIETDRMPESLAKLQANIKVDAVLDYGSLFLTFGLLGVVLFLAALNCAVFTVRWRRAAKGSCGA
jgi:sulfate adenylyltransferase subunit 1 (EFTu-like GTPase family)